MPKRSCFPCRAGFCDQLVQGGGYCEDHKQYRFSVLQTHCLPADGKSLYGRRWRAARKIFLAQQPLCRRCEATGQLVPATVVDHIVPHRSDLNLFWDQSNWQSLCQACHMRKTLVERL